MKIVTLIENTVFKTGLAAEHGLSLLIEKDGAFVLFDTGFSGSFTRNAREMGIDLSDIRAAVISHGHYDHAGGLNAFRIANQNTPIYIKDGFFDPKYRGRDRFIGTERDETCRERLHIVKDVTEIVPGIFVVPRIPIVNEWDTHFQGMFIRKNGDFTPDRFEDEQFLVAVQDNKINIISGCSHRGISNIILSAVKTFNLPINLVLGGFHLKENTPEQTKQLIGELSRHPFEKLGVCHCTGLERFAQIKARFNEKAFYTSTGDIIEV